jgi:hypothetical protein
VGTSVPHDWHVIHVPKGYFPPSRTDQPLCSALAFGLHLGDKHPHLCNRFALSHWDETVCRLFTVDIAGFERSQSALATGNWKLGYKNGTKFHKIAFPNSS